MADSLFGDFLEFCSPDVSEHRPFEVDHVWIWNGLLHPEVQLQDASQP